MERNTYSLGMDGVKTQSVRLTVTLANGAILEWFASAPAHVTVEVERGVDIPIDSLPLSDAYLMGTHHRIDTLKVTSGIGTEVRFSTAPPIIGR